MPNYYNFQDKFESLDNVQADRDIYIDHKGPVHCVLKGYTSPVMLF